MPVTDNGANVNNSGGALSPNQVRAIAYQAGFRGSALDTAVKVAGAESARIPTNRYAPGPQEDSRGLWQINIAPSANPGYANQNLYDPLTNARIAFAMSHGGTNWGPWTTYTSGRYLSQPAGNGNGAAGGMPGPASGPGTGLGQAPGSGSGTISVPTTQNTFDAAGYGKAKNEAIAGSYLKNEGKDPYATGPKVGDSGTGMLFSAGLSTTAPNPMDFQHAQTVLQQIALGGHASSGGSGTGPQVQLHPGGSTKGYVNPIPGATIGRTDMGVDANLPNGAPIRALGDSKVIGFSPNWYAGQPYMLMQLTSGPQAGKYWYVAEAIHPTVSAGQSVRAGQTIGTYYTGGTGIEMGWGSSTPGRTLAQEQGNTGDSSHGNAPAGVSFRNFLGSLH